MAAAAEPDSVGEIFSDLMSNGNASRFKAAVNKCRRRPATRQSPDQNVSFSTLTARRRRAVSTWEARRPGTKQSPDRNVSFSTQAGRRRRSSLQSPEPRPPPLSFEGFERQSPSNHTEGLYEPTPPTSPRSTSSSPRISPRISPRPSTMLGPLHGAPNSEAKSAVPKPGARTLMCASECAGQLPLSSAVFYRATRATHLIWTSHRSLRVCAHKLDQRVTTVQECRCQIRLDPSHRMGVECL